MNIFGVGPMEMGIIAVAALLIFGPGRLPEVMGQAGKAVRDFRRMTAELTGEFEKTIAEAKDIGQSVTGDIGAMKSEVASVTESVKRDLGGTKAKTGKTATSAKTGAATSAGAKKTTVAAKKAATNGRTPTAASTAAAKPKTHANSGGAVAEPVIVASKDDPLSDLSLFAAEPARKERRVRRAVPSAFIAENGHAEAVAEAPPAPAEPPSRSEIAGDDPLSRARQRRLAAGYSRRSA